MTLICVDITKLSSFRSHFCPALQFLLSKYCISIYNIIILWIWPWRPTAVKQLLVTTWSLSPRVQDQTVSATQKRCCAFSRAELNQPVPLLPTFWFSLTLSSFSYNLLDSKMSVPHKENTWVWVLHTPLGNLLTALSYHSSTAKQLSGHTYGPC